MLLMVLFGRSISGIKKTGRHHDNIQNWAILLNEMKKEGIDFRKGAPDMVSGDLQSTLAFQWAVIRHNGSKLAVGELFGKQGKQNAGLETTESLSITPGAAQADTKHQQISIKEQMIRYLNTYLPPDLQVTNFTTSFQDGRVIKYLLSNLANVNVQDSSDPKTLIENCFSSAQHSLGIPNMFSAEDLALARVAEEPVMTYVISILQGIRNATEEGKQAAQASGAHLAALEGDGKAANDLPPPPPPITDLPPPPPPITETVIPQAQPQSAMFSMAPGAAVAGGAMAQVGAMSAADQNYYGSIVQGSVMMELPEIFKIVAFGDYKNFVSYVETHPNEIYTTAEPYLINVLFTAARLTPHITAKKFMEFILERFPNAHMTADRKQNYPMHEALEYGCLENFDFLWNLPGAPRPPLVSLIHTAVWPTTIDCIERVLQIVHQAHGGTIPPLDTFLLEGRTPLITALSTPTTSVEMVRVLLSRGSNPGFSAVEGQSPALVVAAACDKWDAVGCMVRESLYQPLPLARLLVALLFIVGVTPQALTQFIRITGAPTNEEDPQTGRTPLEHAISLARPDLVTVLLQHGAQVNRVSMIQPWRTPIHYALLYYAQDKLKYLDTVRVLQTWGADFNAIDANGQPAANYARNLGLPPVGYRYNYGYASTAVM